MQELNFRRQKQLSIHSLARNSNGCWPSDYIFNWLHIGNRCFTFAKCPCNMVWRLWARTQCSTHSSGKFVCATADCASGVIECNGAGAIPPASLAEFTLRGDGGQDYYDISLVDGFNIPILVTPQGRSTGCRSTSCAPDVNAVCDPSLAVRRPDGTVIACKSANLAFNQPQFCCSGEYNTPDI
ncbi:hypothetical protein POPTR_001G221300v4 [Populus trichocarpa]|uniref:Uncharacterized protein n=1 Tax=Populus trichocarpa TaxID=3694 RepID=A0ACC0TL61_POPTR|nr:hypothetical protein POPTR_001G221300v4 [Populus trichocarpa]